MLSSLLKRLFKEVIEATSKANDENILKELAEFPNKLPMSFEILTQLIEGCVIQGANYIKTKLPFTSQNLSEKIPKRDTSNKGPLIYTDQNPQYQDISDLREKYKKDLKTMFDIISESEVMKRLRQVQNPPPSIDKLHGNFWNSMVEFCNQGNKYSHQSFLQTIGLQKSQKDQPGPHAVSRKVFDFMVKNEANVLEWLVPLLEDNCNLWLDIVRLIY